MANDDKKRADVKDVEAIIKSAFLQQANATAMAALSLVRTKAVAIAQERVSGGSTSGPDPTGAEWSRAWARTMAEIIKAAAEDGLRESRDRTAADAK